MADSAKPGTAFRKFPYSASCCLLFSLIAAGVQANAWRVQPSYGLEMSFDDNYLLSNQSDEIVDVAIARVNATLAAVKQSPAAQSRFSLGLNAYTYDFSEPDDVEVVIDDRVDVDLRYQTRRIQPRYEFEFGLSLDTNSALSETNLNSEQASGPPDDGLVRADVRYQRLMFSPAYLYRLTPITRFKLDGDVSVVENDNVTYVRRGISFTTQLADYTNARFRATYERDLNPINSWSADLELQEYDAEDSDTSFRSQSVGISYKHRFSETSDILFRVGYGNTDLDSASEDAASDDGPLLQIQAGQYTGRTRYTARVGSALLPSSSGDVVVANELIANAVHQFSQLTTLTWRNKLFENKAVRENPDADRRFLLLEPSINWRFRRWWVLDSGLRYRREKRDNVADPSESTAVFLGVRFSRPLQGGG